MSLIEPIDYALEVHAQHSTYCSEAQPFQAQLYGLCFESGIVAHWLLVRCEVPLALLTPHSFATRVIGACSYHSCALPAVEA